MEYRALKDRNDHEFHRLCEEGDAARERVKQGFTSWSSTHDVEAITERHRISMALEQFQHLEKDDAIDKIMLEAVRAGHTAEQTLAGRVGQISVRQASADLQRAIRLLCPAVA